MSETIYQKLDRIEQEVVQAVDPDLDALRYLQLVYRGQVQAEGPRMRAAMACLPFETPKLSVVASIHDPQGFADRLERAIERSGVRSLMVIEAKPIEPKPAPEPSDVTGSMFATERKGRRL
jgi:hypothetical protein